MAPSLKPEASRYSDTLEKRAKIFPKASTAVSPQDIFEFIDPDGDLIRLMRRAGEPSYVDLYVDTEHVCSQPIWDRREGLLDCGEEEVIVPENRRDELDEYMGKSIFQFTDKNGDLMKLVLLPGDPPFIECFANSAFVCKNPSFDRRTGRLDCGKRSVILGDDKLDACQNYISKAVALGVYPDRKSLPTVDEEEASKMLEGYRNLLGTDDLAKDGAAVDDVAMEGDAKDGPDKVELQGGYPGFGNQTRRSVIGADANAEYCRCGNAFMNDSNFCRRCGTPRPGVRPSKLSVVPSARGSISSVIPSVRAEGRSRAAKLQRAYDSWRDHHVELKAADLGKIMRQEGFAPTQAQLWRYEEDMPEQFVPFDYLLACCEDTGYDDPSNEELLSFFQPYDPDGTDFIPSNVFRRLMLTVGEAFEPAEVALMMKEFHLHERDSTPLDDFINYRNFISWSLQR